MGWIYLAELADSRWLSHPGSDQSPIVKTTDTLNRAFCLVCGPDDFQWLQSGMTCLHCAQSTYDTESISFTADSPARISALLALEGAWMESDRVYSLSWSGSLANFDHDSFSWKTCQQSLPWGSTEFSWRSLRWGIVRDGQLSQPASLEPRTCAKDGGYMPTPTARDFKSPGVSRSRKANIEARRGIPLSLWFKEAFGRNLHPSFVEWMMGYHLKHTVLEPWAMQWFRSKRGKRSSGLQELEVQHE